MNAGASGNLNKVLTPRQRNLALLAGLSVALYTVENLIPLPIPWLRIGIGNVGVLLALYMLSPMDGFLVLILKIVVGSLFSGRFLSPFFLFALGAGVSSYWIMVFFKTILRNKVSAIGISAIGGAAHNTLQLGIAYLIVVRSLNVFYLAPLLIILGTISGVIVGIVVSAILPRLKFPAIDSKAS